MVDIVFYEKPGCINNSKQKQLLTAAGHTVECRNLLEENWTREKLMEYFDFMSVAMWFNSSAPDIACGKIDPSCLSEEDALAMMIENPILIRRPLMRVGDQCWVGFDVGMVDQWIGLASTTGSEDVESCPRKSNHRCENQGSNS